MTTPEGTDTAPATTSDTPAPTVSNGAHRNDTKGMATATSNPTAPEVSNGATTTPSIGTAPATTNGNGAATTAPATTARDAPTTAPEVRNSTIGTGALSAAAGNGANGTATAAGNGAVATALANGTTVAAGNGGVGRGGGLAVASGEGNSGAMGRAKGRRTQRERSAASASRLLDAAIELIATQGFAATTQADIGTRAGYSRAMVRERFGSAEALLDALFQRLVDDWHLQAAPLMAGLTGPEVLAVGLELFRDRLRERPLEARCLFVLQFEAAGPTRSLRDRVAGVNRALTTSVACALRDGQADGTVRDDVDPDTAAIDWVAQFRGANFLWLVDPTYDLDGFCARWAMQQFALFGTSVASVR